MVPNWQKTTIAKWALKALEADTHVVSDGLATFAAVKEAGFTHEPIVVGSTGKAAGSHPRFLAVNTTLGNLKTWMASTFKGFKLATTRSATWRNSSTASTDALTCERY